MKTKLSIITLFILAFSFFSCNQQDNEPVNLISPSGQLLAKNTREIKKFLVKLNDDLTNADSIKIDKITYDEEDSVTVAKISYTYKKQHKSTLIYMNVKDSSGPDRDRTLLEQSKVTVIVQPNQPAVIILTEKDKTKDTVRFSTKYKVESD